MGNEMGNRNVSGLQEEEKSVVEETEKYLVGGDGRDEFKCENHVVPEVKDKDFHENIDGVSGGEVFGDGDCNVKMHITDEKGQDDDIRELKLSSQSVEMEVPKESDDAATQATGTVQISSSKQAVVDHDDNPILNSDFDADKLIMDQITIERDTDEIETKGSTFDSTSSSNDVHNVQVEPLVEASSVVSNTNNQVIEKKMEELLLEEEYLGGSQEDKCEVGSVGNEGNGFPVIGSANSSQEVCEPQGKHVGVAQEPKLLVKDAAQEENCEVATADEDGNGFPLVGSLDSSQEVCEPLDKSIGHAQETELMAKDGESQEEKCEVVNLGEEGNGFPLVGSVGSAQEVCEPQDILVGLTQGPELLVKEKAAQEEKREVASVDHDGNAFPPVGSLDSSQEVCEPQDKSMGLPQETKLMAKDGAFQEVKSEVASIDEERNGIILFGLINSTEEVSEPQDKSMDLPQETKLVAKDTVSQEGTCDITQVNDDGNGFPLVGPLLSSQEVCKQQDESIGLTEESKLIVKDGESQAGKCEFGSLDKEGNGFPLFGSADSSQEVSETQDKSMSQEGKCEIGSVAEEGNGFLLFGSVDSSQEVSEPQDESMGLHHQEVTVLVHELLTVPTELIVTDENHQENKSTEEMEEKKEDSNAMGNERSGKETTEQHIPLSNSTKQEKDFLSPSPPNSQLHEGSTITSPRGEKITNKNPGNIVERKSPSFDFDLSLGARLSQESDRTPLLVHDKAATRSLSSRENLISQKNLRQTYQYSKVPLEDEAVSVEEKTIMMERSYSMKSKAPLMNLLKKEEQKEEGNVSYKKADKEVLLTSVKGSNGKRKPMSSFFTTCICCDAQLL